MQRIIKQSFEGHAKIGPEGFLLNRANYLWYPPGVAHVALG